MTHEENLCGLRACDFAKDYPEDSRIRKAFDAAGPAPCIYRGKELIRREDIFGRLMDGTLEAGEGSLSLLSDDDCAQLAASGRISMDDFKSRVDPGELH